MSNITEDKLDFIQEKSQSPEDYSQNEKKQFRKRVYKEVTDKILKQKRYALNTNLRKYLVGWSSLIVGVWLWKVGEILVNNSAFYHLNDSVLITLLTTTTIEVIGIILIVMYDIFNGRSED